MSMADVLLIGLSVVFALLTYGLVVLADHLS